MGTQLSPGVAVREFDFSQIISNVGTSNGAFVGQFKWGPCDDVTDVASETDLIQNFGKPTDTNYVDWFTAKNFLDYTNNLKLVRVINSDALNATPDGMHTDITTQTGSINLLPYSNEITNDYWSKFGITAAKQSSVVGLPLVGFGNSFDLYETAETKEHYLFAGVESNDGDKITLNFWVKPLGTTTKIKTVLATDNSKAAAEATFTLTASGSVTHIETGSSTVSGDVSTSITKTGNWYNCVVSIINVPAHLNWYFKTSIAGAAGADGNIYNRLGVVTDGISFFAPQLEVAAAKSDYVQTGAIRPNTELTNVPTSTIGTGLFIKNDVAFGLELESGTNASQMFAAKYPGALGNSLSVSMTDEANFATWKYRRDFDTKPSTSAFAANAGASNDEIHLVVIDEDGLFTGIKGAVLERYAYLSKAKDARGVDNSQIFYGDVINQQSNYVRYLGPVVSSRTRTSSFVKEIQLTNFGSGYTKKTTSVVISGDGIDATVNSDDIRIVDGAAPSGTVNGSGSKLRWLRPLTDDLPVADSYKIPLTFTQTGGADGTAPDAYATLNAYGVITSVTVVDGGTGWSGTLTATPTVDANGYIKGYTSNSSLTTTLARAAGFSNLTDGLGAVTLSTGAVSSVAVSGATTVFKIRSAVNFKLPLMFNKAATTGSVGYGTKGYALVGPYGYISSVVITDPGEGWVGNIQPAFWEARGIDLYANLPVSGFEINDDLRAISEVLTFEGTYSETDLNPITPVNGAIASIKVSNAGDYYTYASVSIIDNGTPATPNSVAIPAGTGASATVVLETSFAGEDWDQTVFNVDSGIPRKFKSLKGGYGGTFSFSGGSDGSYVDAGSYIEGWNLFRNKEETDISLIISGDCGQYGFASSESHVIAKHLIDNIAEYRKDCVVFLSPKLSDVNGTHSLSQKTESVIAHYNSIGRSSSYAVFDSGWKLQYDPYNNTNRKIPLNADTAGLCAQTDYTNDTWWSPAGFNRGNIKNCVALLFNPELSNRDELYKNKINPVVTFKGEGTVLFGDRTMLGKSSAFSNINVRRLFIMLEKSIAKAAKYQLFEFNDQFTRSAFTSMVVSVLETVKAKRGITDFAVICDTSNNTADVIDRNEFVASIYIKPARSINFITLNFVAVRTGVSFDTVVGQL